MEDGLVADDALEVDVSLVEDLVEDVRSDGDVKRGEGCDALLF